MIKKILFHLLLVSTLPLCFAQETETFSAHEQQLAEFGFISKKVSSFDTQGNDIIPLQKKESLNLSHIVFGFLPYWEYSSGAIDNLHYDLLTHIAVFNFEASGDGTLSAPSGWPWTDVINAAHANSTKIVMVVNNFNAAEIHTLLTNNTAKNTLFEAIKNTISTYQLDGVNIDFENVDSADRGDLMNTFMSGLTTYIHANLTGKEVSFDGPAVNWSGWKFNDLAAAVDHLMIMAYDYNGAWSTKTSAVSPLVHPSGGISVTKSVNNDYAQAIANYPKKIILGVPYYGKQWEATAGTAGATVSNYIGSTFYRNTAIEAPTHDGYIWDTNSETPFYAWHNSTWNQVWTDNPQSLGLKYDLALSKGIAGVGIWALNYDGDREELWDLIETKFKSALSIDDTYIKKYLRLYPNPVAEKLSILNPSGILIKDVVIYSSYGQRIVHLTENLEQIRLSNLVPGVYFVKVRDENGNQGVFKILKS